MQVILNYKAYYEAFRIGVIDDGYTPVTRVLFFPLFDPKGSIIVCDENGVPYEAGNKNSSAWCKGQDTIPKNIKTAIGKKETLEVMIKYFTSPSFAELIVDATADEMYEAMVNLVSSCDISDSKKKGLLKYYNSGAKLEFLVRVFQRAVLGNNKVTSAKRKKKAADSENDSLDEFNNLVRKKKPKTVVPESIQPVELTYVEELYAAYGKTCGVSDICEPEDLNPLNFREHFERQRKNFYLAETVHHETRDAVRPGETDPFEELKDEIEEGIVEIEHKSYENPVEKVDAVMAKAPEVLISTAVDKATFNWIGPGEKKGVCHMLVNDERMKWV